MAPSEAHRAGISGYTIRLAAYYAALGIGTYEPKGYAWFDVVSVYLEAPFTADAADPLQSMQVLRVAFYSEGRRVRYVEFAMTVAGFGGEPVVQLVSESDTPLPPIPPE